MSIYVPGVGSSSAKLVVCGEAPGGEEERLGYPFAGPVGKVVDKMLQNGGLQREECYFTNVVKVRPPGNDIKKLHFIGESIEKYIPQLWDEIQSINPNAILALGNTALEALTGCRGIEKYRGSILQSKQGFPKVIPSIHPASLMHKEAAGKMRSWKDVTFIQWDVNRAIKQSEFKDFNLPRRNLLIAKSSLDVFRFFDRYQGEQYVAVDIETFRTVPLCISFAFNRNEAMSIPLFNILNKDNPNGIGRDDMRHIWKAVAEILYDPNIFKVGQNFKFDEGLLHAAVNGTLRIGLDVRGFFFDTMLAFRTIYPELPGKLQFISSVLTEEPYYKDEGKEFNPKKDKLARLLLYNAKDAVVTYECFEVELEELEANGLTDFFFTRVMPLHPFYSRLEGRGILRDKDAAKKLKSKYTEQRARLESELLVLTEGIEVNVNSNGLKGQVAKLLFSHWKIPMRASTDEKTLDALIRNVVKDPIKRRGIELILEIRKVRKTIGTYIDAKPHPDGRIRTGVRIMLESGRTSTSVLKPPVTTEGLGIAFQTITKHGEIGSDIRSMFVPDPGYIFIEPDLSQAEARVVAILAKDERLLKLFKYGVDIHRVTAGWIWDRVPNELLQLFFDSTESNSESFARQINATLKPVITEEERQIGKKFRHAGHYDMQKRTAGENAGVSEWRAGQILERFHSTNPNIKGVFHKEIIKALQDNNRWLITPQGRKRQFLNRWGEELFREAYAEIPQATVTDHLKGAAIIIERRAPWLMIFQESHDSFLGQIPIGKEDCSYRIIQEELEVPIDFSRCSLPRGELIIPCEIKIGKKNWEEMERVI